MKGTEKPFLIFIVYIWYNFLSTALTVLKDYESLPKENLIEAMPDV